MEKEKVIIVVAPVGALTVEEKTTEITYKSGTWGLFNGKRMD